MSDEQAAVAEAKDAVSAVLSRRDLRLTLCNCPLICLTTHVPLEQRVLRQQFHHASLATRHWLDRGDADESRIPDEPCVLAAESVTIRF